MYIKRSEFSIEEINHDLGIKVRVTYFGLPNENIAALARIVEVTNINEQPLEFELLDGLSQLLPTGLSMHSLKNMSNLMRSWMDVYHLTENVGFFRMRSSTADTAEVNEVKDGHFYVTSINDELITPIVDQRLIFGVDTTKRRARHFEHNSLIDIQQEQQVTANKIPVGFTAVTKNLGSKETLRINTLIGHIHSADELLERKEEMVQSAYIDQKRLEANEVVEALLDDVATKSAFPMFDDYIRQNHMDNLLRGGYPILLEGPKHPHVYHLFSRRHGDLERDYNYFSIAPEFYSQGNGSFRDVCQNRRSDTLLNPSVGTFNIKMFASLIQVDGYNPLSIDGSTFEIPDKAIANRLADELFEGNEHMRYLLQRRFTPGSIINTMANLQLQSPLSDEELFHQIFPNAIQHFEAHFAEGFWIDLDIHSRLGRKL
jgi:hypothetical protein